MTLRIAMVCESSADFRTASELADRVFLNRIGWLEPELLLHTRTWVGVEDAPPFLSWIRAKELARAHRIRAHGHFGERPGEPDAAAARRALLVLRKLCGESLGGVVLVRDSDGDDGRRAGLEQAREHTPQPWPIVVALAAPMRECWVIAGFEPMDNPETTRVETLRAELGFDPRFQAARLSAKHENDRLSPKRVLTVLTSGNREREAACWTATPLEVLQARGDDCGLTQYLKEVERDLVPLFTRRARAND